MTAADSETDNQPCEDGFGAELFDEFQAFPAKENEDLPILRVSKESERNAGLEILGSIIDIPDPRVKNGFNEYYDDGSSSVVEEDSDTELDHSLSFEERLANVKIPQGLVAVLQEEILDFHRTRLSYLENWILGLKKERLANGLNEARQNLALQEIRFRSQWIAYKQEAMVRNSKVLAAETVMSWTVFVAVHVMLVFGLVMAFLEFRPPKKISGAQDSTELEIGLQNIRVRTALHGTILLVLTLAFYALFIKWVYPVTELGGAQ